MIIKSIAIMQPTFLPWVGYFGLMDSVDEFIFLDHVQFNKRSWQQRNKIKTANGPIWLTVPIQNNGTDDPSIIDVQICQDSSMNFPGKMIKAIEHNYKKSPFYNVYSMELLSIFEEERSSLCSLNMQLIHFLRRSFGIDTPIIRSSDILVEGKKAELIANICKERAADQYISAPASREYMEQSNLFNDESLKVIYFEYTHPSWQQLYGDFVPYMSSIDLLFNQGPNSSEIIRSGMSMHTA